MTAVPGRTKRAVLGEIGNKVNTMRGVEPIDRTSLLQKEKKKTIVPHRPVAKPVESLPEKPPVQIVKPVVKTVVPPSSTDENSNKTTSTSVPSPVADASSEQQENRKSFSTDLLKFEDIDEQDKGNPILVSLYTNDIHEYLRSLEHKFPINQGYLAGQEVTAKMRSVLVDWLIEVHQQFRLMQETLYLTIAIIDRFLQVIRMTFLSLQLSLR